MPRDYKHRAAPRRRKRRNAAPRWLWIVAILAVGLFVAFLFYLQQRPSQPNIATPKQAPTSTPLNLPSAGHDVREVKKPTTATVPPPLKPRFDFYTILPEAEVLVPEKEITGKLREGVPQVEAPGTYLLQVGSFSTHQQADQYKAKLALLGLQADIQKVTLNNNETRHRVRVGPFNDLKALNTARARLNDNQIDAILLRVNQ